MAQAYQDTTEVMQQHLHFVAKRIGINWRWLGRKLKIPESDIGAIDEDYNSTQEKAFQALEKWYQAQGRTGATKEALVKALKEIKQTSIAEELGLGDRSREPRIACQEKVSTSSEDLPWIIQEQQNESPVSKPTYHIANGYKQDFIEKIEKELGKMLKICQDNLSNSCQVLVNNFQIVQCVQALNTILAESSHSYNYTDEAAKEEREKAREIRIQHTWQTECLIASLLSNHGVERQVSSTPKTIKGNKQRPKSEILQRCTSVVSLQRRSETYSSGGLKRDKGSISSPLYTSQLSLVQRSDNMRRSPTLSADQTFEERPDETEQFEVFDDKTPLIQCCDSCINMKIDRRGSAEGSSEHKESTSFDKNCNQSGPTLEQTNAEDVEVKEEHHNSKL